MNRTDVEDNYIEEMETTKIIDLYPPKSATALKKRKLYNNEQMEKTTIKKNNLYNNNSYIYLLQELS